MSATPDEPVVNLRGRSARGPRLVVDVPGDAELRLLRPKLRGPGGKRDVTGEGLVIGVTPEGRVGISPGEAVRGLVEVEVRGGACWARMLTAAGDCRLGGERLTQTARRMAGGDVLEVRGERFTLETGAAVELVEPSAAPAAKAPQSEELELRFTVAAAGQPGADVRVRAPAHARLGEVLRAAADAVRVPWTGGGAHSERLDCDLDVEAPIGELDILWGDRLTLSGAPAPYVLRPSARPGNGRVAVNRSPRVHTPAPEVRIELESPPDEAGRAKFPLAASLLPLVAGIAMAVLLKSPVFLIFTALTPIMAASSYFGDRRSGRGRFEQRQHEFRGALHAADGTLRAGWLEQRDHLLAAAPGPDVLLPMVSGRGLWQRERADRDFLSLRIGLGSLPFEHQVSFNRGGSPALRAEADQVLERFRTIDGVPIQLPLRSVAVAGITGNRATSMGVARALVVQAALLHSPADLVIAAAVSHAQATSWSWLKWLPQVVAGAEELEGPPFATGDISAAALLERVQAMQEQRLAERHDRMGRGRTAPHVLLVVDGELAFDRALATTVLGAAPDTDVSVLWIAGDHSQLPQQCRALLRVAAGDYLDLTLTTTGHTYGAIRPEPFSRPAAERAARALAPMYDAGARGRAAEVPTRVALLDLLALERGDGEEVASRWVLPRDNLAAPVGAGATGPFTVDLRRDGPHSLVVGTTGSGKSELLRTLVCSLAVLHPPTRVSFLLFDYKGGAAFGPCVGLPHVVDVVSDLDDQLARRALIALEAELVRRERILSDAGAKDMLELARRTTRDVPPALILAVDEFAKLREEIPTFVDGVVDVAQRGRSLGVHMVLASQLLGNAFTTAIRANTNLRLALRAADDAQSEDAIGARDAARIPSGPAGTGRGFARIGQGRLTEFQTAYVSGRSRAGATDAIVADRYELIDVSGNAPEFNAGDSDGEESDLTVLAAAARDACRRLGLVAPPPPWLPPLALELPLGDVPRIAGEGCVAIGMVDEPARQLQRPLTIDFERAGFTVVFGSGGSGRTTVLRTLAAALAAESSPEELHLYALDGGSRGLAGLTHLPHCAAVVTPAEEERVDRLLGRLERMVEQRSREFADLGATNLPERLRRRPELPCPRVVLLIDDLGEVLRTLDTAAGMQQMTRLIRLVSAGRQLGIAVVATASSRSAVGTTLLPHVARRIVLGMGTAEDALALGVERDAADGLDGTPGRGIVDGSLLVQIAHVGASPAGEEQLTALQALGEQLQHPGARPPAVRTLPEEVSFERLPAPAGSGMAVPIGIGGLELETVVLDLTDRHLLVSGPRRSGRSTLLATLVRGLRASAPEADVQVLTPKRAQPLEGLGAVSGAQECGAALLAAAAVMDQRLGGAAGEPLILVVDDAGELTDAASGVAAERLVRRGLEVGIHIVAAADKGTARGFTHPWVRQLANDGHGAVLQPEDATQAEHLGAALPRRPSAPVRPGRGYLVRDGEATIVQTAR